MIINLILLTKAPIGDWVDCAIPTWIWHVKYVSTIYNEKITKRKNIKKKHGKNKNEEEMKKEKKKNLKQTKLEDERKKKKKNKIKFFTLKKEIYK